jgi:hypothetical protein
MTVTFELEPRDLRAFAAYNRGHHAVFRRARAFSLLLVAAVSGFMAWTISAEVGPRIFAFVVILPTLYGLTRLLDVVLRAVSQWRLITPERNPGVLCQHTVALTDDALVETTAVNESRQRWIGFYDIVEAADHVFLFVTTNSAHIVPKRAFPDAAAAHAFFARACQLRASALAGAGSPRPTIT